MKLFSLSIFLPILAAMASAGALSDSLPIEGHYAQAGRPVSRFKLERFLLDRDSSSDFADRSLGNKWCGHALGALLWSGNIGMTIYEVNQVSRAIQDQVRTLDTTGRREPFSNRLYSFSIPLTIGTEAVSFVQARLYTRSDYLFHRAALAYNASLAKKSSKKLELSIVKTGWGEYAQDGLVFFRPVLYSVLMEQHASAGLSAWSWGLKETGIQLGTLGATFLALAAVSILQQTLGDTSFAIDIKERQTNLTLGISLTVGSIATAIVSAVIRKRGIIRYNEALARQNVPVAPRENKP
jgi:hypothetical protein